MIMLKTALNNLRKNPVMNIICLLQLAVVFLITAVMISTMSIRYRTYAPLKSILENKGFFANYDINSGVTKPGGDPNRDASDMVFSNEELLEYMNADRVAIIRRLPIYCSPETASAYLYDRELLRRYTPELKRGRWVSPDADELEVVISEGLFGLDVGDEVDAKMILYYQDIPPIKIKVVGVLEDTAKILGVFHRGKNGDDSYRCLYNTLDDIQMPVVIASTDAMERLHPDVRELSIHAAFYTYNDITYEELKQQMSLAGQMRGHTVLSLEDINRNSREYLKNELLKLLPIVIMLMILVVVSSVSVSAIATRQRLKDYAKYYVLGLQWKQCAVVNLIQALITGAAALAISIAALFIVSLTPLSQTITIILNVGLVLSLLGILALYLVFSMIMPLLMLRSTTPKALLQSE